MKRIVLLLASLSVATMAAFWIGPQLGVGKPAFNTLLLLVGLLAFGAWGFAVIAKRSYLRAAAFAVAAFAVIGNPLIIESLREQVLMAALAGAAIAYYGASASLPFGWFRARLAATAGLIAATMGPLWISSAQVFAPAAVLAIQAALFALALAAVWRQGDGHVLKYVLFQDREPFGRRRPF